MIVLKSAREIELMKEAGRIVALVHERMAIEVKPGVTTAYLDKIAEDIIVSNGATPSFKGYQGFPASICASINEELVHGIPSEKRILKDGDIISIDVGACYKGYHGDSAWTYCVGSIDDNALSMLEVIEKSLFEGIAKAIPGNRIGDISHAIGSYLHEHGYSIPEDYTGHGIGKDLHENPIIHNFGRPGKGPLLKTGMVLAIEPMAHMGRKDTVVLMDGWTVVTKDKSITGHYEHTVVITEDGNEILTSNPEKGGHI